MITRLTKNESMRKFTNNILIILGVLIFTSCGGNKVFEDFHKMEKQSWNRFTNLKFEMPIEKMDQDYDVFLSVRHLPEFQHKIIPTTITIYMPSGDERTFDFNIKLYNNDGEQMSECLGDFCDVEELIRPGLRFSATGKVRFEIENKFTKLETPGILEIGLIVRKAEEERYN